MNTSSLLYMAIAGEREHRLTAPSRHLYPARRPIGRALIAAALATLILATAASAHGGGAVQPAPAGRGAVQLRDCWMTVAYVPRPGRALQKAFPAPLDLRRTFYGPDPMLGVWAVACDRARVAGRRVGPVILSLVGVPVALTDPGAPPLANFFAHALIRVDSSSPALARHLRRQGLPARVAPDARYRHSRAGVVPSRGLLDLPGRYRLVVRASAPDPTNPHTHVNRFSHRRSGGRTAELGLRAAGAFDRFCFPASGGCRASVHAPPGSALARLLGGSHKTARAGFDHARLGRIDLETKRGA